MDYGRKGTVSVKESLALSVKGLGTWKSRLAVNRQS
jgi:hypothetical protein